MGKIFSVTILGCFFGFASIASTSTLNETFREFPHIYPNKIFKIWKVLDSTHQEIVVRSDAPEITSSRDLVEIEKAETFAAREITGAMTEQLYQKFLSMSDVDSVWIQVHAEYPEGIIYLDKTKHSKEEMDRQSISVASISPIKNADQILKDLGIKEVRRINDDVAQGKVDKAMLKAISKNSDIAEVSEVNSEHTLTTSPLYLLAQSAYYHASIFPPPSAGTGVKIATFESGLDPNVLSCWSLAPALYDITPSPRGTLSWHDSIHTHITFRCMANSAPHGIFYHRKSLSYDGPDDQNYLFNNGIQSVSMSTSRGNINPYPATRLEFEIMDDFAYREPYPVFSNPASNNGWKYETNWQGYNGISVGNVQDSSFIHYKIGEWGGATQTRNPKSIYGGNCLIAANSPADYTYCSSDREMPYIVAPGWTPTGNLKPEPDATLYGTYMRDPCLNEDQSWGTSLSAPTLNGIAADVIASAPSKMTAWPEKVRAVLMATSENVDGGEWNYNIDGRDGAGVVNGETAVAFAQGMVEVAPSSTAVTDGLGSGSVSAA